MEKILVIAEKPSAARDIASILGCIQKKNGYIEGEKYIVTWALGHLVKLKEPEQHDPKYKQWNLNDLPFHFEVKDSLTLIPETNTQFQVIKKLIHRDDVSSIINAGDAGREGYLIQEWIYRLAGNQKPKKVLWASSLTEESLRHAFANLKDPDDFTGLLAEAEARAEGDFMYGINYSRALTLTKANGVVLNYGRCQTPTLNFVVMRDREIEKFHPTPYFNVQAEFQMENSVYAGILVNEEKKRLDIEKEEEATTIQKEIEGQAATVIEIIQEEKKTLPPLLYDLTTLQKDMSKQYKYTAKETLQIAQSLYEKHKILSYPRTDSKHLSEDVYNEIEGHIESCNFGKFASVVKEMDPVLSEENKKRYVNDLKVTDHHALIPNISKRTADIYSTLEDKEKHVFDAVVYRLLSIFYPAYEYDKTEVTTQCLSYLFLSKGKVIKNLGWKALLTDPDAEEKEESLPALVKEEQGQITEIRILNRMTKAPEKYTDSSLLSKMEQYNIGTPATRADIIEKLKAGKTPYMEMIENKNSYQSTDIGKKFIDVLPSKLKDPEFTNIFEKKLNAIEDGKLKKVDFLSAIQSELMEDIQSFKTDTTTMKIENDDRRIFGTCPLCKKGLIYENRKAYGCSEYKDGCQFVIWKVVAGKKLTEKAVIDLIEKGETGVIKGFKSKQGKSFAAKLALDNDSKVIFKFMNK